MTIPIAMHPHPFVSIVSSKAGIGLLVACVDLNLVRETAICTVVSGTHEIRGKIMVLLSSVGPNLVFASTDEPFDQD